MGRVIVVISTFLCMLFRVDIASSGQLLASNSLSYLGAFRVPDGNLGGDSLISRSLALGGRGLTYNPVRNSLIMAGRGSERLAIEISIPTPINSNSISALQTATVVQVPGNVADGQWDNLNIDGSTVPNGGAVGSFLVYNGKLIGNAWPYYLTGTSGHLSHFTASLNWASEGSQFSGFKRVGVNPFISTWSNAGWTGGYMCLVPPEWRERLGAPALTGNGGTAVLERTSRGPSVSGFDPDRIGVDDIAPAEVFFGYPDDHRTLGEYMGSGFYYNASMKLSGITFPENSDSVLVFGSYGLGFNGDGTPCYGFGTSDIALHGTTGEGMSEPYCYDPPDPEKGTHGYPYVYQVWAYNANDILDVRAGTKKYWEIIPYAIWNFTLPYTSETSTWTGTKSLGGVAYDPTTQRIFITQSHADTLVSTTSPLPIVHVFKLNLGNNMKFSSGTATQATGTGRLQ